MIICAQCGGRNEDNENFCGVCGSYLEWDGSRVEPARAAAGGPAAAETTAPAAPAAPAATPSPTPGPSPSPGPASNGNGPPPDPQVVAPVNPSVSQPVPPSVTQPAPPPVTGAQAPTAPTVPLQPVPPAPPVPPTARPATDRSAPPPPVAPSPPVPPPAPEMPVVPAQQPGAQRPGAPQRPGSQQPGGQQPGAQQPGAQQPGAQQPGAQRPGAAQARRRQYVDEAVDEPPPDPGDLICGQCGAGNVPTRRFCRRCGNSLADAPVAGKKSWWRRLLDWFNRDGRRYQAGHRRKVRLPSRLRKLILLVLVVAVGGFLVLVPGRGPIRSGVNMVRDQLGKHVEVTPARAEASSTAPGSSPQQVIDGATNTFWAPAARGDSAVGGWVQTEFANPVRLLDVIVHPGVAPDRPTFLTEGRPKALRITVTSKSGKVTNKDITLPDVQGSHRYSIKASDAVTVRFTLLSAYGAQVGRVVAIAELEFFVRG